MKKIYRKKIKQYLDEVDSTNISRIKKKLKCQDATAVRLCFELLAEGYITAVKDTKIGNWIIKKV